jgi:hypothetical protein
MNNRLRAIPDKHIPIIVLFAFILAVSSHLYRLKIQNLSQAVQDLGREKSQNLQELNKIALELENLKSQDQIKINENLNQEIKNMQTTYSKAVSTYELLADFKDSGKFSKKYSEMDTEFSKSLKLLSERKYTEADKNLDDLSKRIKDEMSKLASIYESPQLPQNNTPPNSGYSRQLVNVEGLGSYTVSLVAADLSSTKVIVDTASDSDCLNNCPVYPLATYVSRTGAYAGINGSYFCPASYPSCSEKTNSFDLLLMNYKKRYFNSENNVYSTNPAVVFGDNYVRFVRAASEWGRDTSPNGVLSNYPLLIFNSQIVFDGDGDPKKGSKGGRSFVASKENKIYIGVVHNATVAESAKVLKTLGMENALNLDDGGSTALWYGGYKVGPGRDLPNVILFVKK